LPHSSRETQQDTTARAVVRVLLVLVWLYLFLLAVSLMGVSFKLFGKGFSDALLLYTGSPITGLFIGILATSIVQSSSTVTSTVVALVASGSLTVENAVPIVVGSNIGTSITSIIVAMGYIHRPAEFGRAFGGSIVHDFHKVLVTVLLFPIEVIFRPLQQAACALAGACAGAGTAAQGLSFASPVKMAVEPLAHAISNCLKEMMGLGSVAAGVISLVFAAFLLFLALLQITRTMKFLMLGRVSVILDRTLKRGGILSILVGLAVTAVIQSSSVTTSLLVPLVAAGILDVVHVYPLTLGACIGTTVTALLASLAGGINGLVIALVHVLFNLSGVCIVFPTPLRKIPIALAEAMGRMAGRSRKFAIGYVVVAFFVIPIAVITLSRLFS
jgi:sodium-dependent phosphate cotransporter